MTLVHGSFYDPDWNELPITDAEDEAWGEIERQRRDRNPAAALRNKAAGRPLDEPQRCLQRDGSYKASYRSPAKARRAIRRHQNLEPGKQLRPYPCRYCRYWHLTSASPLPSPTPRGGAGTTINSRPGSAQ